MSTIIYKSPIFGPVLSRRLGVSLGINLLPASGKICSFDCIYCECGFAKDTRTKEKLPTRNTVQKQLEKKLIEMSVTTQLPEDISFAGNGEPTLHPDFYDIVKDTILLRDQYVPSASISVLTNGTNILDEKVFQGLLLVDNNLVKLDTVDMDYIRLVNRPNPFYDVEKIIDQLIRFGENCVIQTLFMTGEFNGKSVDNTTPDYVLPWIEVVMKIRPREVMIYTIDRETPTKELKKASHESLDAIVQRLEDQGIIASASY